VSIRRFDHLGINVEDLEAVTEFFLALGLVRRGEGSLEGGLLDQVLGTEGGSSEFVFVGTPDGSTAIELVRFHRPPDAGPDHAGPTRHGMRHVCFEVDDLDAALATVRAHDLDLVGEVAEGGGYRLCFVRGPEGLLVELAERSG
jgi:catechol 2,3-dioxygenase-like lactoylglutathione lyase family enzyme